MARSSVDPTSSPDLRRHILADWSKVIGTSEEAFHCQTLRELWDESHDPEIARELAEDHGVDVSEFS